ncbi:MAG: hypothetical protein K8R53_07230 [Bacteroidales bacterium]|nr:hypothetical protein [Bacteroidales bacterium]
MSDYSIQKISRDRITDPQALRFIDHVTDVLKVSAYQALYNQTKKKKVKYQKLRVGGKVQKEYNSFAEVIQKRLETKKPGVIESIAFDRGPRTMLGKSAYVNLKSLNYKSSGFVLDQIEIKKDFSYVNDDLFLNRFSDQLKDAGDNSDEEPKEPQKVTATRPATKLELKLKKVKCKDETDPDWLGKDEISMGGVAIDDKENEAVISEFKVGKFNDGDSKSYSDHKLLKAFALDNVNPSTFTAFLTLAEKDSEGFSKFLQELYDAIKAEIQIILDGLGAAAGAGIGAAIGGSVGTVLGGPIGTIIGVAAGLILEAIIRFLIEAFKDDIFEPNITAVILNRNSKFTGPTEKLVYQDFGGKYYVWVYWVAS